MNDANDLDATCTTTTRKLAMDVVQAANSGHRGTPTALAPVACGRPGGRSRQEA
jgi:transketolase